MAADGADATAPETDCCALDENEQTAGRKQAVKMIRAEWERNCILYSRSSFQLCRESMMTVEEVLVDVGPKLAKHVG